MDSTRSPPHRKPRKPTLDTTQTAGRDGLGLLMSQEGIRDEKAILDLDSEFRSSHDP